MGALRIGPGLDPASQVGPLINAAAPGQGRRAGPRDAVGAARRVLTGGEPLPGTRASSTRRPCSADVPADAACCAEEIFGPVAPVVAFDTEAEAVALANDTEFGLVSYVYTGDLARGLRVAEALESGMVGLNRGLVSDPAAPFGGVQAERPRPGGRPRGLARVHRVEVRRGRAGDRLRAGWTAGPILAG